MQSFHVLVLTDHQGHIAENSVYALASALYRHPQCVIVDIASRGTPANKQFFAGDVKRSLAVVPVTSDLEFEDTVVRFMQTKVTASVHDYDFVLLRLPPPFPQAFGEALLGVCRDLQVINHPAGIQETGSKEFLLNFPEICPPMALVKTEDELKVFANRFPIVLKPLRSYSGRGVARVHNGIVSYDDKSVSLEDFISGWDRSQPFLAMQFLKNVDQGDKRVVVCNGEIVGASLRLPKPGEWRCNVGLGGQSVSSGVTPGEREMARILSPQLRAKGILMYGFDTLVDDEGKRILSEINTTSIGGLKQMEIQQRRPILSRVADLFVEYFEEVEHGN